MNVSIQTICVGTPQGDRLNEDTYCLHMTDEQLSAAVFDGVTDRLFPSQYAAKGLIADGVTGSAYAARQARDTMAAIPNNTPEQHLLNINEVLNARLHSVYGTDTTEAIYAQEPALTPYADDSRFVRLVLPACVATAISIQRGADGGLALTYAHVGDTELLLFYADGRTERAIVPSIPNWQKGIPPGVDGEPDPTVRRFKRMALFHNYVDEAGQPDASVGIGALNGLPTLPAYILTGQIPLVGVDAVCVCSDGLMWPHPREETAMQEARRLSHMRQVLQADGITGYVDALRAQEASDPDHIQYPRPKTHDDATGIFIKL